MRMRQPGGTKGLQREQKTQYEAGDQWLVLAELKELETMMKPGEWATTMEYQDRSTMVMTSTKQETIYSRVSG